MNRWTTLGVLLVLGPLFYAHPVQAFCGFYVAKADAKLFNKSSQVVLVRDGNRTVITMANDYQGDLEEFAIVIPVPTFLERDQIHVGDPDLIAHIDAYTAPRLVEYFDPDPCRQVALELRAMKSRGAFDEAESLDHSRKNSLGVTIEAEYTVGEYDILILSARESRGLESWSRQEGER